ncbi:hypothetical protein ACFX11_039025 [Malus domestica]
MPIRCYQENGENPVSQPHPASHKSKIHGIGNGSYELYNSCSSSAAPTTVNGCEFQERESHSDDKNQHETPKFDTNEGGLEYYQ